jgi:hypothetical protein
MDTAKLPARLHKFYPLDSDLVLLDQLPSEGEEDFDALNSISDHIILKLEQVSLICSELFSSLIFIKDYTKKIFPAQVVITINSLPQFNSRCCPYWSCPTGGSKSSFSLLLTHLEDAHPDAFIYPLKLSKRYIFDDTYLIYF